MADDGDGKSSADGAPIRAFCFEAARNVALLAVVYLYFAGFVYRDFFAHTFGIPTVTDTPVYTYLVYAYNALRRHLVSLCALALALFGYHFYTTALEMRPHRTRLQSVLVSTERAVFGIVAVALFPWSFFCAQSAASADALAIRCGVSTTGTPVVVSFKKGRAAMYDPDFISAVSVGVVYLLARTDDSYYVLYQPAAPSPARLGGATTRTSASSGTGCTYLSAARTYQIPKDDVAHVMTIAPTFYR